MHTTLAQHTNGRAGTTRPHIQKPDDDHEMAPLSAREGESEGSGRSSPSGWTTPDSMTSPMIDVDATLSQHEWAAQVLNMESPAVLEHPLPLPPTPLWTMPNPPAPQSSNRGSTDDDCEVIDLTSGVSGSGGGALTSSSAHTHARGRAPQESSTSYLTTPFDEHELSTSGAQSSGGAPTSSGAPTGSSSPRGCGRAPQESTTSYLTTPFEPEQQETHEVGAPASQLPPLFRCTSRHRRQITDGVARLKAISNDPDQRVNLIVNLSGIAVIAETPKSRVACALTTFPRELFDEFIIEPSKRHPSFSVLLPLKELLTVLQLNADLGGQKSMMIEIPDLLEPVTISSVSTSHAASDGGRAGSR
jgi:hypothetical protein